MIEIEREASDLDTCISFMTFCSYSENEISDQYRHLPFELQIEMLDMNRRKTKNENDLSIMKH